jgi:GNAT superfamily N-acetyltransferase
MDPTLVLTDAPTADARHVIDDGLAQHGVEQAGYWSARPLAVLIKDPTTQQILGGLVGRTSLGLLFIDLVFVPERLRNRKIGTRILRMAEDEATRRGCQRAVLYTISFQAPRFYEHRGWREFGRIPCDPQGTSRVFMTKELSADGVPTAAS